MSVTGKRLAGARRRIGLQARRMGLATGRDIDELRGALRALEASTTGLEGAQHGQAESIASLERLAAIDAISRFVGTTALSHRPLVSVVLPTFDRPDCLGRAVSSVRDQRYDNWELLVVDDGGTQDSQSVVEAFDDDRIRWSRIEHSGPCAARNHALGLAGGELIAYLDDDNLMDPGWLLSVVWAFAQRPEAQVLYGAFVIDDLSRVMDATASGDLPRVILHPFDREVLRQANLADTGSLAHRAGLPEAWWDESLLEMGDWDLLVRLTADRDPLVLPAIAEYYTTDAPDRLSNGPTHAADRATVVSRAAVLS